jgi:CRP-like cAMP-binding protein
LWLALEKFRATIFCQVHNKSEAASAESCLDQRRSRMAKNKQRKSTFDPRRLLNGRRSGQSRVAFAPDQVIYTQGDPADAMFYVESGRVKIAVVSPSGKEALVASRIVTATALTICSLIRVTRSALTRLLREEPDFAVMFATDLVLQSIHDQESIVDHLTNPAEKRLVRTLLQLANAVDGDGGVSYPISTPINHAVLAKMIGTTRPRVSFFLNKFRKQGFIAYDRNGQISVRNSLRSLLAEK